MTDSYLDSLNQKQKQAVISKAKHCQILGGSGSGKTRVLVARVAYLVLHEKVDPSNIIVATLTREAAFELKELLQRDDLLGPKLSNQLMVKNFHAICRHHLELYCTNLGLPRYFRVIEPLESTNVLYELLNDKTLSKNLTNITQPTKSTAAMFMKKIAEAKGNGLNGEAYTLANGPDARTFDLMAIFKAYDDRLRKQQLMDYGDLLLFGRELFKSFPHITEKFSHILVDEFQNIKLVPYDIVYYIARNTKHLTIVGDPDQNIYGFGRAKVDNVKKMIKDFDNVEVVTLEENYRNTNCILTGAYHVIQQDSERFEKGLFTKNDQGIPISLLQFEAEIQESFAVANEILRIIKFSKGLIQHKDIAILVRAHYLTQNMEAALKATCIPYNIVGGVGFFDRMEVKDLVSYVHFIYNPEDTTSFRRIINSPDRDVDEKTLEQICIKSRSNKITVLDVLRNDNHECLHVNLKVFLTLCHTVKNMIDRKESIRRILDYIIKTSNYEAFLKKNFKDHTSRWENIGELMTIAGRYDKKLDDDGAGGNGSTLWGEGASQSQDDGSKRLIGDIAKFVTNTTFDPTGKDHQPAELRSRVQLMTIHAAQGREWPCVFILACEQGIIPLRRSNNVNEETRLLYTAMTRAKCFLYICYARYRSSWAIRFKARLSNFLQNRPPTAYQQCTPAWNDTTREWVAHVLGSDQRLTKRMRTMDPDDHPGNEFPNLAIQDGSSSQNRDNSYMYDYDWNL